MQGLALFMPGFCLSHSRAANAADAADANDDDDGCWCAATAAPAIQYPVKFCVMLTWKSSEPRKLMIIVLWKHKDKLNSNDYM